MVSASSDDEFDVSFDLDPAFLDELAAQEQSLPKITPKPQQQQQQQFKQPSLPPPPARPPSAKPHQQILRPPAPPPSKRTRLSQPPAPSQSQASASRQPWVHPNPFIKQEQSLSSATLREEDEDDTPLIIAREGGYQVGGALSTAANSRQPTPSYQPPPPPHRVVAPPPRQQPQPPARAPPRQPSVAPPPAPAPAAAAPPARPSAATTSGLSRADLLELQQLRSEKARLENALHESQSKMKEAQNIVFAKTGEITMVRKRLTKAEEDHAAQRDKEMQAKRQLEDTIKAKDAEHRRELERLQVDHAFKRQEIETSASRRPQSSASQWQNSATRSGARAASQVAANSFYGGSSRAQVAGSPSIGRGSRASSVAGGSPRAASRTPAPAIRGFVDSFADDSPAVDLATRRTRARSSDLMPPPSTLARRGSTKGAADRKPSVTPGEKGKGKRRESLMKDEFDEGDSFAGDDVGGEDIQMDDWSSVDRRMNEGEVEEVVDEDGDTLGRDDGRDYRSEIISAVLNHTTLTHFDSSSATAPSSSQQTSRPTPTGSRSSSATATSGPRFATACSSSLNAFASVRTTQHPGATLGAPSSAPTPSPTATGPVPTWRALTAVRFEPGMALYVVNEYEALCCELYGVLGRKESHDSALESLVDGLCRCLISLMTLFEREATIGPLITALELLSSLVLVYPQFTAYLLPSDLRSGPSALLELLAKIVCRFGRPTPPPRQPEKLTDRGKARERSRRSRGMLTRVLEDNAAAQDERVQLEPGRRAALLFAVLAVLEGLAWRMSDTQEDSVTPFLTSTDSVATLLDPNHPTSLLTSSVRFLSLVACRPALFRTLIGVKFTEGSDVRHSKVPLFDRCGTLLVRPTSAGQATLDQTVISLVTILTTKHEDSVMFVAQSTSFIPELLEKIFKDVRTLWESDGQSSSDLTLAALNAVVARLSATVHLFYYLTCSPISTLKIAEFFSASSYAGLHDRFNVAFGTLAFAGLPDWAEGREDGQRLTSLGFLAQEIMEDVSPEEAEQIESCFANPEEDDEDGMEEDGEGEVIIIDDDEDEDEEVLRAQEANLSQGSRGR